MSRIKNKFLELNKKKEKALITYIMSGYPNEKTTISAIRGLLKGGADIIEIGFPFSDPIADGPIIQNASTTSLNNGTKIDNFFKLIKKIRKETDVPLVLMTYSNILYRKGFGNFMKKAKNIGIDGLILPDMSIEESENYLNSAKKYDLDTIFLISPNTSPERIKKILKATTGFLYLVSIYGTTGVQAKLQQYTIDAIKKTKKIVNKKIPVGIGFGVNTPNDAKKLLSHDIDAIIVGSAFLRLIDKTPMNKIESKITTFTKSLKNTTK
ncbi:MAG TPA: tryptophan synthase subunit alpha [Nitrosopumilaceae archaeon]|nr:tryptophan synthase subunit alpha [Nitrosopumilaceae archaeon]